MTLRELIKRYPFAEEYFKDNHLPMDRRLGKEPADYAASWTEEERELIAIEADAFTDEFFTWLNMMKEFMGIDAQDVVESLTIVAGRNKSGTPEGFDSLTVRTSEIISIVGPTGSGKSRLLADIEWTAQCDTPTGRAIRINGEKPDLKWRFSTNNKLVAQLSQNMNFVMDLTVDEFLTLHAQSRHVENSDAVIARILDAANDLAGENFDADTPVTALSGGQSRALMIADTAILSTSPIILIDEIENAGVDRRKALDLLVREDKIVLMATHDPGLALMADKRIVINNGGIIEILETTPEEKACLTALEAYDEKVRHLRESLRYGKRCTWPA
ncbi:MAG: ATP-binding cassette domain-containing protein [Eubacteriales bacterium]|nr:ATP-binding cassette domain-containing protein [Eubacteriales bacterium]